MANDFLTGLLGGVSSGLEERRKRQQEIDTLLMTLGLKQRLEMPMKEREQQFELEKLGKEYEYKTVLETAKEMAGIKKERQKEARTETQKIIDEARKRGWLISPEANLPPEKQLDITRQLFVAKENEYYQDLEKAIQATENKADITEVYRRMAQKYPHKSVDLKRIFFPQSVSPLDELLSGLISPSKEVTP